MRRAWFAALAVVGLLVPSTVQAAAPSWLDAPLRNWNRPGAAVPSAPADADPLAQPRCAARERTAVGPEESAVVAAGWRLESYWATARAGDLALVTAQAGYDGMCRPRAFNGFVFAGGRFAGTISPEPMSSREDGVLFGGPMLAPGGVEAAFTRYLPSDPLCCPSGGRSRVTYRVESGVLIPERIAGGTRAPTQLPRTGGPGLGVLLGLSCLALVGGALTRTLSVREMRRGRCRGSFARFRHSCRRPAPSRT